MRPTCAWLIALMGLVVGFVAAGCGGRQAGATAPASSPGHGHGAAAGVSVEAAALPFRVLRARGGQEIAPDQFFDELSQADAVCVGEVHPNPHHHWAQLQVLEQLDARGRAAGVTMALGMEMFQRPFQGVLDDFAAGRIDEQTLLERAGWKERWGYDFGLYRPLVRLAVARGMALVGLNVSTELRKKLSRAGIEGLSPDERARLPELDLEDEAHKAWFDGVMAALGAGHGHGSSQDGEDAEARARRIYTTQVLWDETMAETAARWLAAGDEGRRQMVILAGTGHCHDTAIVKRMRRRGVGAVVSVLPVIDDGQGRVAAALAAPISDYLFVMSAGEAGEPG